MISRRTFAKVLSLSALPVWGRTDERPEETSDLIYLTPILSDGRESRCQAEVWFQAHEGALYVVTAHDAWRAEAVRRGLTKALV